MGLTMLSQNISRGFASWKRVKEVLHTEPQLQDGSFDGQTEQHGKIEFRNVSFSYPGSNRMVLKNINLTIRPGETVAIMGATGCGKSALVNLIPRFYDAAEGTVLVDGVDVREYTLQALRNKVSIALQKAELFHQSIAQNIAAAQAAQAEEFITGTADGYATTVAACGSHEELLQGCKVYRDIYDSQMGKEELHA